MPQEGNIAVCIERGEKPHPIGWGSSLRGDIMSVDTVWLKSLKKYLILNMLLFMGVSISIYLIEIYVYEAPIAQLVLLILGQYIAISLIFYVFIYLRYNSISASLMEFKNKLYFAKWVLFVVALLVSLLFTLIFISFQIPTTIAMDVLINGIDTVYALSFVLFTYDAAVDQSITAVQKQIMKEYTNTKTGSGPDE